MKHPSDIRFLLCVYFVYTNRECGVGVYNELGDYCQHTDVADFPCVLTLC